ncbi:MAG: phytoene desaturase family protein [Pseudanabaena sp.]
MNQETEVIVIGSGIGGLCCAGMLAKYGIKVIVCESHSIAGGAAHSFSRQGYTFDSGPSLFSGMSVRPSTNPLAQVLDALEENIEWLTYEGWGCAMPEGQFFAAVGNESFIDILTKLRNKEAVKEWQRLQTVMLPLGRAATALPPIALRNDWKVALSAGKYLWKMLRDLPQLTMLTQPFSKILEVEVSDPFILNWMNLLCFMLSGLPANGTLTAEIAFMFADWYRPEVQLDYPKGGVGTLVEALVRGLQKYGGELLLNSHVQEIILNGTNATGVRLVNGEIIQAKRAVISGASIWDTLKLLPLSERSPKELHQLHRERQAIPACPSFMHLQLGIEASDLPKDLPCHWLGVHDWEIGVVAPQNVVAVSMPSVLDPDLAPTGKHIIHAYTPATEPFELWAGLDRKSEAYQQLKQERAEILWQGIERYIPDVRNRCEVTLIGTPLTHARFLRRDRGSYGPAIAAGQGIFPNANTPISKLYCCGDSTFPGIGLPAVAASGEILANSLASLKQHQSILKEIFKREF